MTNYTDKEVKELLLNAREAGYQEGKMDGYNAGYAIGLEVGRAVPTPVEPKYEGFS